MNLNRLREMARSFSENGSRQDSTIVRWGLWPDRTQNPITANPRRYWSQSDEDGILEKILARTGASAGRTFLEYGVGDGSECNSLVLLAKGWSGAWFGAEALSFEPKESGRLLFNRGWLDLENITELTSDALRRLKVDSKGPDVVSMDLDGNDYYFTEKLLQYGIRPRVWISEYNAKLPPGCDWKIPYDAAHQWAGDDFFGGSLGAFERLFGKYEYFPVACSAQGSNVFFVSSEFEAKFQDVPREVDALYQPPLYLLAPRWGHRISARTLRSLT